MAAMKRRTYGRDAGLTARMLFTGGLLGLLYVVFAVVLFQVLNVGLVPMLVIVVGLAFFQYFTSDKLALRASGREGRRAARRRPALHDMVERLCAMADLPKPRIAIIDTPVPNAFATGRSPEARGRRRDDRASGSASSRARSRACSRTSSRTSPTATC